MHKQLLIVMLICLKGADYISAQQWTKKDSVWLQNVLSGKEKLELNPETMKAIQSGSFINLDEPASDMKMSPVTPLPILKDFTEYIQTDSTHRKIALKDLPPGVFWLYAPPPGKFLPVYKNMLETWKNDPMNRSHNTGFVTFDFAEMTSRKSYIHKRNAKRDGHGEITTIYLLPTSSRKRRNSQLVIRNLPGRIRFCHARIRCS